MRTTVTLDDDTLVVVKRLMREHNVSFKQALNDAIRRGAQRQPAQVVFETQTADLGVPSINLDRALQLAGELEDEELIRRQRRGA
ncbi:antitoxin [Mycobacterium paraterrae]|uniref:Antitoxin n=1 Tax=Mycobacterium paraterrae TaxID=577492 RepID=A0ABY3VUS3_9MYCO|nr:antitoxin [Mycobacterium paraterrae]UMB70952.1 antitoxin [Mycobacterium paraterrae]